jgi:hypothetical protein
MGKLKATKKAIGGLPFFGIDFSQAGRTAMGWHEMQRIFEQFEVSMSWVQFSREHGFFFSDGKRQHTGYYPILMFLKDRFDKCVQAKLAGFGIWELSIGVPYFSIFCKPFLSELVETHNDRIHGNRPSGLIFFYRRHEEFLMRVCGPIGSQAPETVGWIAPHQIRNDRGR